MFEVINTNSQPKNLNQNLEDIEDLCLRQEALRKLINCLFVPRGTKFYKSNDNHHYHHIYSSPLLLHKITATDRDGDSTTLCENKRNDGIDGLLMHIMLILECYFFYF